MREVYEEYHRPPVQNKITDKAMLCRAVSTVCIIITCLIAMSVSAYAFFSYSVTSEQNKIKGANFETEVSITITENGTETTVAVEKKSNASYTADLKAGKIYTVILDETETSTAGTGFCALTAVGCPDAFHSQQIGADANAENEYTDKVKFQLKVTADTTVTFSSHLGTSVYYSDYVNNGNGGRLYVTNQSINENKVVMLVNGVSEEECDAALKAQTENNTGDTQTEENADNTQTEPPETEEGADNTQTEPPETEDDTDNTQTETMDTEVTE